MFQDEIIELAKNGKTVEIEFFGYVVCEGCKKRIRVGDEAIAVISAAPESFEARGEFRGIIEAFQGHEIRGRWILLEVSGEERLFDFFGQTDFAVCSEECKKKYEREIEELFG